MLRSSLRALLAAFLLIAAAPSFGADSTIPALTAGGAVGASDLFWCVQGGGTTDRKCTGTQILTWVQSGWGTGVSTAMAIAPNTAGGFLAPAGALAANALVIGGGSGTGPSTTTTGTGVVTAVGNNVNTNGGLLTASTAAIAANAIVTGAGSGTALTGTTPGTGVLSALGVNVGSAGAFVRNNAAETISGALTLTSAAPQLTLGVNATTLGSIKLFGNTSGDLTISPAAAAGTASAVTFPGRSGTVAYTSGALTSGNCAKFDASGNIVDNGAVCGGGGGTPGGSDTQVQFNDGGSFGGDASFVWDKTANTLTLSSSLTGTEATNTLLLTPTWNTTGAPAAFGINVTNTASNTASRFLDFKVGGTSMFAVRKDGSLFWDGSSGSIKIDNPGYFDFNLQGVASALTLGGFNVYPNGAYTLGTASFGFEALALAQAGPSTGITRLFSDAANTLALRNSTNAQTFNIYNTYTDAANYERMTINWSTNVALVGPVAAGTGTQRSMRLQYMLETATGSGTAPSLASNTPTGATGGANYTWITVTLQDGSTGYIPVWK